jgi:hypothetical protein
VPPAAATAPQAPGAGPARPNPAPWPELGVPDRTAGGTAETARAGRAGGAGGAGAGPASLPARRRRSVAREADALADEGSTHAHRPVPEPAARPAPAATPPPEPAARRDPAATPRSEPAARPTAAAAPRSAPAATPPPEPAARPVPAATPRSEPAWPALPAAAARAMDRLSAVSLRLPGSAAPAAAAPGVQSGQAVVRSAPLDGRAPAGPAASARRQPVAEPAARGEPLVRIGSIEVTLTSPVPPPPVVPPPPARAPAPPPRLSRLSSPFGLGQG